MTAVLWVRYGCAYGTEQFAVEWEQAELQQLHAQADKTVSCGDVWEMMRGLGMKTSKVCATLLQKLCGHFGTEKLSDATAS